MSAPTTKIRSFQIHNLDDLGKVHASFEISNWLHYAVEDANGCAHILAEHDDGELYVNCGDEDGWTPAAFLVKHRAPVTVLSEITVPA